MRVPVCACVYACVVSVCLCVFRCVVCACVCMCTRVCCVHRCMCVHVYFVCIYTCVSTCMYVVCMCMCTYVCVHARNEVPITFWPLGSLISIFYVFDLTKPLYSGHDTHFIDGKTATHLGHLTPHHSNSLGPQKIFLKDCKIATRS